MADFVDNDKDNEDMEGLEKRHKKEIREMEGKVRAMLKTAKKNNKAELEAKGVQMENELNARHKEEKVLLEEKLASLKVNDNDNNDDNDDNDDNDITNNNCIVDSEDSIKAKKLKAQKKKEKRATKEANRLQQKDDIAASAGPSLRALELDSINKQLAKENLKVKEIISDGNCLYRAVADQLADSYRNNYNHMRILAANYMRTYREEFEPFLGLDESNSNEEYELYCNKVESEVLAEWGGQLEVRALACALNKKILIYDAQAPVLTISNNEDNNDNDVIRLTYHRHYFSLGEHYNSVVNINEDDN